MKQTKVRLLLLQIMLVLPILTFGQLYTFTNYNHRSGLNMASINSINQSEDGYIWVGTDGAELVRFDGQTFEELKLPEIDDNHHISNISFYEKEVLFASRYKGFYSYIPSTDRIQRIGTSALKIGESRAIFRRGEYYYVFGDRGIVRIKGKEVVHLLQLKSEDPSLVFSQFIETEKSLFVLSNRGNFRFHDGKLSPIHQWLNVSKSAFSEMQFGYYDGEKIAFFNNDASRWMEVVLNEKGGFYSINPIQVRSQIPNGERIISCSYNVMAQKGGILTTNSQLYVVDNKALSIVASNYTQAMEDCISVFTDLNGDFWLCSTLRGIYKVSLEPFTRLELHPVYQSPTIGLPYRTNDGTILIGTYDKGTFVGNIYENSNFSSFDFTTRGAQTIDRVTYLATNTGIRILQQQRSVEPEIRYFENQNVTFILADGDHLWAGVAGKGLYRINTKTNAIQSFNRSSIPLPEYYYTGQIGQNGRTVYFGTNDGLVQYERKTKKLTRVSTGAVGLGAYSGVSTKDKFGTCWFTLEKGLVGFSSEGKIFVIQGSEYFKSTLFYTLNSDAYGNLIIGTNKGLTFLRVNKKGQVTDLRNFDDKSGFLGYETNMRSQFQSEDQVFLGTVEGLFMINTKMLEYRKTPIIPVILPESIDNNELDVQNFKFQVNNAKAGNIRFVYRVLGQSKLWTHLSEGQASVLLTGLPNGEYTLEVKASYDGVHFSEAAAHTFTVQLPIWKSNWFVLVLMAAVVLINVVLLNFYKTFDSGKLMSTKDIVVHLRMTPFIILFAAITVPTAQILAPLLVPDLDLNIGQSLILGFTLLTLYFLSLAAKSSKKEYLYDVYLKFGLFLVISNYMWEMYTSELHPFNVISLVLVGMVAPYILSKIKSVIIFSIVILSICICYVSILNDTVYPKSYFLIAMFTMSALMIFTSFLRYDSLEKLIFISSIINKGNIPAVAFDREGKVTYSSENISNFANITHDDFIGNNISILNDFIPFGEQFKEKDITKEFEDGETYLVPMENGEGKVRWIEWSYKDFSRNIKVILGQDVTEKMELENTYELLVQNAEDFIYRCDIDGRFVFLNDICYSKMGYTKKDLLGLRSASIIPETHREEVLHYYRDHFASKLNSSYREFPIVKKNGDIIWVGQYVTTLYSAGSDSHVIGFIALARDITSLRAQQQLISDQQDEITASINYARRIQYNLLPNENAFENLFDEHFIFSRPKDIVSGDFYWMQRVRDSTVLVLADCTGHGVPGSFMTLLGNNLLNSIVLENGVVDPGTILNDLDKKLKEYLPRGKGKTAVNDGMEVTICVFNDRQPNQITYACAGSRFLVYEKNEFTMFKGDNKHIGDIEAQFEAYSTHYSNFSTDFSLFLFTDGFQDQFGGSNDKKYSFRRLLELFESNIFLPLSEQRKMIEDNFNRWIGKTHQTDDVTIISVKCKIEKP